MKRMGPFALVVCLLVLALAVVLGVAYPSIQQEMIDFFGVLWDGILDFFEKLIGGLRAAF